MIVGIDPGKDGGLAALIGDEAHTLRMPFLGSDLDTQRIQDWIDRLGEPSIVAIELQTPQAFRNIPKPAKAAFSQGDQFGSLKTLARTLGWPVIVVDPKRWQRAIPGIGIAKLAGEAPERYRKRRKAQHIECAARLFPRADITGSSHHAAKAHDGICDALLIAHAARLEHAHRRETA